MKHLLNQFFEQSWFIQEWNNWNFFMSESLKILLRIELFIHFIIFLFNNTIFFWNQTNQLSIWMSHWIIHSTDSFKNNGKKKKTYYYLLLKQYWGFSWNYIH